MYMVINQANRIMANAKSYDVSKNGCSLQQITSSFENFSL